MEKKTLVMGATPNPDRYAYKATVMLAHYGYEVVPFGIRKGNIQSIEIQNTQPKEKFDTVTLYLGPHNQPLFYDYIIGLKPRRVIFNPGTENEIFEQLLKDNNIDVAHACTLVLLSTNQF